MSRRTLPAVVAAVVALGLLPMAAGAAPPDRSLPDRAAAAAAAAAANAPADPDADDPDQADADGPLVFAPQGLTADRFPVAGEPERVDVEAHDGVLLHARVYRPDTSSEPDWLQPIILVHSPYYSGVLMGSDTRSLDLVEHYTPKGYAVVLTDVRGTGNSGGCGEQDGINQQLDFGTLVDHFGSQPWSNGRVAGYGKSYDAETQHAGAIHAPEHLTTMVSVAGISGLYDVAYFDGVPLRTNGLLSAAVYAPFGLDLPSDPGYLVPQRLGRGVCEPANFANGADPRGDMTPYWAEREFRTGVADVTASTLYVMGLSDFTVSPIAIDGWYDELPTFKRAIFGQWAHWYPYDAPDRWARDDWYDAVHAWLDHELLDLDTGVADWPDVQVQSEDATWRAVESFAGMGTALALALTSDGSLAEAPGEAGSRSYREDGSTSWTTPALEEAVTLSGQVELDATIALDRPDAHLAMTLQEVRADGSTRELTRGYLSAPHRDSLEDPEAVPMGEPVEYAIRSYPFDRTVAAGSAIRLVLAGYDSRTTPALTAYTAEVATGEDGSVLRLPVVTARCGVVVDHRQEPPGEVAGCPGGVPGD
jgi:X-Pro dipeptidyl-peptidase